MAAGDKVAGEAIERSRQISCRRAGRWTGTTRTLSVDFGLLECVEERVDHATYLVTPARLCQRPISVIFLNYFSRVEHVKGGGPV